MAYFPLNIKVTEDHSKMKEVAAGICRDFLNGMWKCVTAQNIGFKHISGGLSNLLYHISLPEAFHKDPLHDGQPKEVLIRIYGQTHGEGALEALITESVIFTLLSERGLGPKLHGIFPGGRIEQYINARPLLTRELASEKLSTQIARKMAAIHTMEVPLNKDPSWLWNTIGRWLDSCESKLNLEVPGCGAMLARLDLRGESQWLKKRLEIENSPVLFCHNDMQEGNILIMRDTNGNDAKLPKVCLIDFEYCSYNYRAFDIANHFLEWTYDYTAKEHPFFTDKQANYPNEKQRLHFIRAYLDERGSKESPQKLMREVEVFRLASHFFWGLWAIINADSSQIPFGYWEYAVCRLSAYLRLKEKYPLCAPIKRRFDDLD